jgi:hypothetical protein
MHKDPPPANRLGTDLRIRDLPPIAVFAASDVGVVASYSDGRGDGGVEQGQEPEHRPGLNQRLERR